ncbi:MAG: hypothetical protein BRD25_03200 [Bacteroidetes bacterium QH_1_61_8]|nr:MAG: hypothetical protein BRD25_03200 [Bacteroidetes bacterium QH_1_61_8]
MNTNRPSSVFVSIEGDAESLEDKIEDQSYRDRLEKILEDSDKEVSETVQSILGLGAEWLGVENGHLTEIDPAAGTHTIALASGEHPVITPGATTNLSNTYCRHAIAQDSALALTDASGQGFGDDPAHQTFGLSTYFGTKVVAHGELYGTVCFVDREPRPERRGEPDAAALALLTRSIEQVLEQRWKDQILETQPPLETVHEESPAMIVMCDEAGNLTAPNMRLRETTGYEAEGLVGMSVGELDQEVSRKEMQAFQDEMEPGDHRRWEGRFRQRDGGTFPVDAELRCLGPEGEHRFVLIARDITGRQGPERRYAVAFNRTHQFSGLMNPDGTLVEVNDRALRFGGLGRRDVVGKPLWETYWTQTGEASTKRLQEAIQRAAEGEFVRYERKIRGESETRIVDFSIHPIADKEDEVVALVGEGRDITERRKREEELRRERNLLEQTQKLAGAWEVDLKAEEASWSEEVYRIHEIEPGTEVSIEEETEIYMPESHPRIREAFKRVVEEKKPYDLELPINTAKGNRRWIRTVGAPVKEEDGEVVKVAGAHQDITDRKRAERALQKWEARLRGLANSIPGVVFQFSAWPDGTYESSFVSERAEEVLGISAGLDGFFERFMERGPAPHREELSRSVEEATEEEKPWQFETPFEKPSGEQIWLSGASTPERREGELVYNGVILDITDRKEAEEGLRRSEERFRKLFESAPLGIATTDEEGRIVQANPTLRKMTGYEAGALQARSYEDITHREDLREDKAQFEALLEGDQDRYQIEKRYVRADGEVFWGRLVVSRYEGPGEGVAIRMIQDIDDQKRYEQQLHEAKEEAQRMNRLKSAFLANMSHEIRTPLTSIIGFAEMVGEEASRVTEQFDAPELGSLSEFARLIEKSGRRLMDTLTGILNLSKLQAGEMDLSEEKTDLAAEAEDVVEELTLQAEEAGIYLQIETGIAPVWAMADEKGLQIALRNLVSNAIKYTEEGGQILVFVRQEEDAAVLEVEDTGIGMNPEVVEDLFEPFRQASEGFMREYEGSGLGLAITNQIVEGVGGSIAVDTEKGEGTCFTVRFPAAEEERPDG